MYGIGSFDEEAFGISENFVLGPAPVAFRDGRRDDFRKQAITGNVSKSTF
jgi:hypothetical protein